MPNPGAIIGAMGESFEQLGKDIVTEAVSVPKDITSNAMESLGVSIGGKKKPKKQTQQVPQTPEQQQKQQEDEEVKRAVARRALEEISGKTPQKEPSVWEKLQQEEEQKKEQQKKQKAQSAMQSLPAVSSKRKRGDLYGMKAKKASAEMSRNVRQD